MSSTSERFDESLLSRWAVSRGPLTAPIKKGTVIARLKLTRGQALALDIPLDAKEDVVVGSLPRRSFDAGMEFVGQMMRKYVLKK